MNLQTNTLWVFGDSFANCTGVASTHPDNLSFEALDWFATKYSDFAWPVQLASLLGFNLVNLSRGGASNEYIIRSLIKNIPNIQEGDKVVVLLSHAGRFRILDPTRGLEEEDVLPTHLSRFENTGVGEDFYYSLVDYMTNVRGPYLEGYLKDDIKLVQHIGHIVSKLGGTLYFTDNFIWNVFENWEQFTHKLIPDKHFSLNGNTRFALYFNEFINNLEEKKSHRFLPVDYNYINNKPFSYWQKYRDRVKDDVEFDTEFLNNINKKTLIDFLKTNTDDSYDFSALEKLPKLF